MQQTKELVLVLDNIRSMYNVGAIFRLSEGLGVSKIYLCGITPRPPRAQIHKTALGAESEVPWEHYESAAKLIQQLQRDYTIAVLELTPDAISLDHYHLTSPLALVVGHETEGVGQEWLKAAQVHLKIPMHGQVHSLNVATATAIAVWHLLQD